MSNTFLFKWALTNEIEGYTSNAAAGLRDSLLGGPETHPSGVHSRVLGNVLYLMASLTSNPKVLAHVEAALLSGLGRFNIDVREQVEQDDGT